jgi:hypothetical protein
LVLHPGRLELPVLQDAEQTDGLGLPAHLANASAGLGEGRSDDRQMAADRGCQWGAVHDFRWVAGRGCQPAKGAAVRRDDWAAQPQQDVRLLADPEPVGRELLDAAALVCPGRAARAREAAVQEKEQALRQVVSASAAQPAAEPQAWLQPAQRAAARELPEQPLERA